MARYIDADKLIEHLKDEIKACEPKFGGRVNGKSVAYGTELGLKSAISFSETLATADVAPKSEVEKAIQDGIRAFCAELEAEITADRDRAYDSITERNRQQESHLNDAYCIHEDGKLVALNGMLYSLNELLKKHTEGKE